MSAHVDFLVEDIMQMVTKMGDYADLDFCENLAEYEDHLHDLSDDELSDTYSFVSRRYERWFAEKRKEAKNANAT